MALPVIAITNASTCLTDTQVEAVLPALQRQVSIDFRAYWDLDCALYSLARNQPLTRGWWQIVITDDPDQAGALGYHEMTSQGTPLGKVFARLDLESGAWEPESKKKVGKIVVDEESALILVGLEKRVPVRLLRCTQALRAGSRLRRM